MNGDSDDEHFDDVDSIDANDDERYGGATMESRMGGDEPTCVIESLLRYVL